MQMRYLNQKGRTGLRLPAALRLATFALASLLLLPLHPAQAQEAFPPEEAPPGFQLVDQQPGAALYRKDYPNGNPDFVQVIDLSRGARLELMYGEIKEARPYKGDYGGPDPSMTSLLMETYWQELLQRDEKAFCVCNGLFFYMPEYPTRLAFPLKVGGKRVTDGWGKQTYVGEQLLLELWSDHASISPLTEGGLKMSTAPDLIGGLTENANKRLRYSVGRTFLGIRDRDQDGGAETILILNTLTATQAAAAASLRSFGAEQVMMLDGGGSTQLTCRSGAWIQSDRPVPQAIGVVAAEEPPVSARLLAHSNWTVVLQGEPLPLEFQIENTGPEDWSPATTSVQLRLGKLEFEEKLTIDGVIRVGESATFHSRLEAPQASGAAPVTVYLAIEQAGKRYPLDPIQLQAVVLPLELQARQAELQAEISRWVISRPKETAGLVDAWIADQRVQPGQPGQLLEEEQLNQINLRDAVLIPLLMLPIMALIAWSIARNRQ